MQVQAHYGNTVVVESQGKTIRLIQCLKRYNHQFIQDGGRKTEYVEVWEDVIGHVYRLSRPVQEGVPWLVHRWA
ncbi:hypothetical protein [Deinococcus hopiensis]|nr:hypothetical protein [Deinococcus hopiensis]